MNAEPLTEPKLQIAHTAELAAVTLGTARAFLYEVFAADMTSTTGTMPWGAYTPSCGREVIWLDMRLWCSGVSYTMAARCVRGISRASRFAPTGADAGMERG